MKQCPYCAEDILDEAIKCKHCGSWLVATPPAEPGAVPAQTAPPPRPGELELEYHTVEFENSPTGQRAKIAMLNRAAMKGWKVESESITPGSFKGGQACCLFAICPPFAFLAGHTSGGISVTLSRPVQTGRDEATGAVQLLNRGEAKRGICLHCGYQNSTSRSSCKSCRQPL